MEKEFNNKVEAKETTDFLQRLIIERNDLSERTRKLRDFIKSGKHKIVIQDAEQIRLLEQQLEYMEAYLDTLTMRMTLLGIFDNENQIEY